MIVVFCATLGVVLYSQKGNMDIRGRAAEVCYAANSYCTLNADPPQKCCNNYWCVAPSGQTIGTCKPCRSGLVECVSGRKRTCLADNTWGTWSSCSTNLCSEYGSVCATPTPTPTTQITQYGCKTVTECSALHGINMGSSSTLCQNRCLSPVICCKYSSTVIVSTPTPLPPTPTSCITGQTRCVSGRINTCVNGYWSQTWSSCGTGLCSSYGTYCATPTPTPKPTSYCSTQNLANCLCGCTPTTGGGVCKTCPTSTPKPPTPTPIYKPI